MLTKDVARHTIADLWTTPVVRPPNASDRWQGVNHGELMDALTDGAAARGWRVGEVVAALSRGGAWLTASFDVRGAVPPPSEALVTLAVGVCVSNDTRHGLMFYAGGRDHDRDAAFAFDFFPSIHSYTVGFRLGDEVENALDRWASHARRADRLIARAKNTPLSRDRIDRILLASGRGHQDRRIVAPSFAFRVDGLLREIESPSAWDVIRAFGRVADQCPTEGRMDQLIRVWQLVTAPAGVPVAV